MQYCVAICFLVLTSSLMGQAQMVYTKAFTKKLERSGVEFYHPVERWLKASSVMKDDYMSYDLVLHSFPDLEARIVIDRERRSKPIFPNVEITRILANISTNDQESQIKISKYPDDEAKGIYGADLVVYADFIPKTSYSTFSKGRILCQYKEGVALLSYIILYEDELDPYFEMPMRFEVEAADQ